MNFLAKEPVPGSSKTINILLTNDDGIDSQGVRSLIRALNPFGRLWLATPSSQRSATSHGITTRDTIPVEEVRIDGTERAWRIGGMPADCVKLALIELIPEPIHLVISGINEGANLGTDTLYSGTVAAALEGAYMGVPSLAISLAQERGPWDFRPSAAICAHLVRHFQAGLFSIPPMSIVNVNVPQGSLEEIKGYRAARLGVRRYTDYFHLHSEETGVRKYLLRGDIIPGDDSPGAFDKSADIDVVAQGYVSFAPISVDRTAFHLLDNLHGIMDDIR